MTRALGKAQGQHFTSNTVARVGAGRVVSIWVTAGTTVTLRDSTSAVSGGTEIGVFTAPTVSEGGRYRASFTEGLAVDVSGGSCNVVYT